MHRYDVFNYWPYDHPAIYFEKPTSSPYAAYEWPYYPPSYPPNNFFSNPRRLLLLILLIIVLFWFIGGVRF